MGFTRLRSPAAHAGGIFTITSYGGVTVNPTTFAKERFSPTTGRSSFVYRMCHTHRGMARTVI